MALERIVFSRLAPGARVLDLCCGSGDLCQALIPRGYQVTGLDGSEEMLRYARAKAPSAEFLHRDARDFELRSVFDAVLSTFDSLNHVLTLPELERVFVNARRALVPGGFLCFDLNMETCFRTIWRGASSSIEPDRVWMVRGSYDPDQKMGRVELTMFRPEKGADQPPRCWRRLDVTIAERCYAPEEIQGGLERAGFRALETHDAYDLGMRGDTGTGRSFFVGFK